MESTYMQIRRSSDGNMIDTDTQLNAMNNLSSLM